MKVLTNLKLVIFYFKNHQSRPTGFISFPKKWFNSEKGKGPQNKCLKKYEDGYHRCSMTGHWSCTCRTIKYLVDLYQASIKEKTKKFETNFAEPSYALVSIDREDITSLDVSDFFEDSSGRVDHLIGDESIHF
ncbi:hypothetical protein I3760_14G090300 [Carya illinoinensis]|nr:hypothetical protein I3760_14G090300 [Carya illinoinensis]